MKPKLSGISKFQVKTPAYFAIVFLSIKPCYNIMFSLVRFFVWVQISLDSNLLLNKKNLIVLSWACSEQFTCRVILLGLFSIEDALRLDRTTIKYYHVSAFSYVILHCAQPCSTVRSRSLLVNRQIATRQKITVFHKESIWFISYHYIYNDKSIY